jgi:hypothetical protein
VEVEDALSTPEAAETWTRELPSWVLSRRRAVLAAFGFSKVTSADWASLDGLRERELILPLSSES